MPPPPSGKQPVRKGTGQVAARPSTGVAAAAAVRKPVRRPAPAQSKLIAQTGPASGQEFPLEGDELAIGRAADNPVSIPDTSVSRKHALVRNTGDGWAVSDLGSGNGTLLNGEPIADETQLNEGDVITLGDTELRFSGPGGGAAADDAPAPSSNGARRPPVRTARNGGAIERSTGRGRPVRTSRMAEDPEEAKKKRRKLFLIVGGASVVILALLVGWKAIDNKRQIKLKQEMMLGKEHQAAMAAMFKEAKDAIRAGKWTDAKAKLEEMQAEDAAYETRQVERTDLSAAGDEPVRLAYFDERGAASEYLLGLYVFDRQGRLLAAGTPGGATPDASPPAAPVDKLLRSETLQIGITDVDRRTGRGIINVVRPLHDRAGRRIGSVLARVDSDHASAQEVDLHALLTTLQKDA